MTVELLIEHEGILYAPAVEEGITWQTDRYGSPGELNFTVIRDSVLKIGSGDAVRLTVYL